MIAWGESDGEKIGFLQFWGLFLFENKIIEDKYEQIVHLYL